MMYDLLGKKMTAKEVHHELLYNPYVKPVAVYPYLAAQQELNAEKRIAKETDPDRKALMERLYSKGIYNFDYYFGEE